MRCNALYIFWNFYVDWMEFESLCARYGVSIMGKLARIGKNHNKITFSAVTIFILEIAVFEGFIFISTIYGGCALNSTVGGFIDSLELINFPDNA